MCIEWNLTIKSAHGTSWIGLNTKVVSMPNKARSQVNVVMVNVAQSVGM